jgi:3',5'-cyclic-AMP phosphodiesterase
MLIAHLSDTHVTVKNKKAYGIAPTSKNLAHCVESINELTPVPDFVLITGDITYGGLWEECNHSSQILNKLQCPYYIVPGNHDNRSTLFSVFKKNGCPTEDKNFINYTVESEDIRLIALDTTIPGESGGEVCSTRISWLKKQLSIRKDVPTILFMHHPPAKCRVLETDEDGFIGADPLERLVSRNHQIKRILCGHIHMPAHLQWGNTVISTAPSMGMDIVLDLTLKHPSEFMLDAPSYLLHYLTPDKGLVSHLITVKDKDGPYHFREYLERKDA